jgi:hypothetical protein
MSQAFEEVLALMVRAVALRHWESAEIDCLSNPMQRAAATLVLEAIELEKLKMASKMSAAIDELVEELKNERL